VPSDARLPPQREVYDKLNQYINEAEYNDELINDAFDKLVSVLYISSQGALTVMVRSSASPEERLI
jgi:hypothetical protein